MQKRLFAAFLCFGWLASITIAPFAAEPCDHQKNAAACRYTKGLLWKIERSGQKPSFLFGTIHLSDPRVTHLPEPVQTCLDTAHSFTMELIADGDGIVKMAETMFFSDGRTLESTIGADRYCEVQRLFTLRGIPLGDLNKKKPWVISMMLSMPPQKGGVALDFQLPGFFLTPGQAADVEGADQLLPAVVADTVIGDKGYDAEARVVQPLRERGKTVVIPSRCNRQQPRVYDEHLYEAHHLIENFFAKLKQFRAIATRYDKRARNFLAGIYCASICVWLA